ncbi:MAG TPA: hypothetical protein PLF98_05995 [Thermotogota bacterium]|nr:hypothetical protein [Thermotogota bacterium]HQC37841.1 hypothetical protein [Thermotogota bacterium]
MMRMVRFFVLAILLVGLLTSCTVFKDLFLNANKIGKDFVTALNYMLENMDPVMLAEENPFEFNSVFGDREIDTDLTTFMNTYVHLSTGITKSAESYLMLEGVIAYMSVFFKGATFLSAEKIDIPNVTTSERIVSPVWCGNHPAYVSKGVLVKMRLDVDKPGWDSEMIVAWPLMIIEDKPYMFTVYNATIPESEDSYYPFYPIPFFIMMY